MTDDQSMEQSVRAALAAQGFMQHVGANIDEIAPGRVVLSLDRRFEVLQQHGFFHGGAIAFLVDNATTCAAGTMVDRASQSVLTAEFKLNYLSPADGVRLECVAEVVRPGRAMSVVEAKVWNQKPDGTKKPCAIALATIAVIPTQPKAA